MNSIRRLCLLMFAVLLVGSVSVPSVAGAANGTSVGDYTLGAGDRLEVTVFGHEDLSGVFEVDGSGFVSLPLIGRLQVGGMSLRETEDVIVDALEPDYLKSPKVSIQVTNYRPFYILGEVENPGGYPYSSNLTVIEAIALAGGYSYRADEDDVAIIRAGTDEEKPARHNTVVLPGDTIVVPERFF